MPTTGYLREKKGRYYAVLNLYDSTGKRIQKSHATGLPVKNNKRKAEQILKQLCVEYSKQPASGLIPTLFLQHLKPL